jgi:hypothetical protein
MQIDMTRPNPARVIDYWLGGIHNFEIDRQLGDQVMQAPLPILENEESREFLKGERRVGVIYISLGHLMTDDQVLRAAKALYEWTMPGSYWFLTHAPREWETEPLFARVAEYYRMARVQYYLRSREELLELLRPWQLVPNGATFNQQWGLDTPGPAPSPIFSIELMVYR